MKEPLYLNDLLRLDDAELTKTKIKFNQQDGNNDPRQRFLEDPDKINNQWLFWRDERRYFNVGQSAICFLQLTWDTWLLTTIKRITKELGVKNGINYEGEEIEALRPYFGRVIIKYHKTNRTQVVYAKGVIDKLEVVQILPSIYDGEGFPGYDKVRLSFSELERIINHEKGDWIAALTNQKAVYLITDTKTGKHYVGAAYSNYGMLWQRWKYYIDTVSGGNVGLIELVDEVGFDYVKRHFQYAILENYNARVNDDIIIEREKWWKGTLKTREFGYNKN